MRLLYTLQQWKRLVHSESENYFIVFSSSMEGYFFKIFYLFFNVRAKNKKHFGSTAPIQNLSLVGFRLWLGIYVQYSICIFKITDAYDTRTLMYIGLGYSPAANAFESSILGSWKATVSLYISCWNLWTPFNSTNTASATLMFQSVARDAEGGFFHISRDRFFESAIFDENCTRIARHFRPLVAQYRSQNEKKRKL